MKALNRWTNRAEEVALEEVAVEEGGEDEVPVGTAGWVAEDEAAIGVVAECNTEVASDETPLRSC